MIPALGEADALAAKQRVDPETSFKFQFRSYLQISGRSAEDAAQPAGGRHAGRSVRFQFEYPEPLANSGPRLDADSIIDRCPNPLLAAHVTLSCLNRNMPQKELNLFQLTAGSLAQLRGRGDAKS